MSSVVSHNCSPIRFRRARPIFCIGESARTEVRGSLCLEIKETLHEWEALMLRIGENADQIGRVVEVDVAVRVDVLHKAAGLQRQRDTRQIT